MRFWHIHADDRRWLRNWMRGNLVGIAAAAAVLIVLRFESAVPIAPIHHLYAVESSPQPSTALAPDGWRRTTRGWEHISNWPAPARPLAEWISIQQHREPAWMQQCLKTVRELPPLLFALIQLALIAAILLTASAKQRPA